MSDGRIIFSVPSPSFGPVSGGLESWRSPGTESGQALRRGSDFQKQKEDERIDVCLITSPPHSLARSLSLSRSHARYFPARSLKPARLDRFALIVPDELLHFLANVSPSAIGKERNEGKSLPPWRCHFHTLRLAACQQTGHSKEAEWTERNQEPNDHS
ncbi:hypothetical protein DPX16_18648 [Anabarilius grahami]|uniref:Uncharacterized protein n=1 Tax=Anabarilius grahami TaxID=495550 RepID=A0A3N0YQS3_ANAGA|nr:hypothetical protein DPX16_18648 [Anabarilius grahami]